MAKNEKDKFAENPLIESMRNDDAIRLLDSLGIGEPIKEPQESTKAKFIIKILAVEDDESSRVLYKNYLLDQQCHALIAENGKEGMDLVSEHPDIKAIILDIKMPPPDGISFLKTIRKLKLLEGVPIVVVSGHLTPDNVKTCMDLGVAKIYTKPVDLDAMFETIKDLTPYESQGKALGLL